MAVAVATQPVESLPVVWDLEAYRGDSWSQTFRFLRGGEPVDLSAATVEAWARNGVDGNVTPLVVVLLDAADGQVTIQLPLEGLPWQSYAYDVEVTQDGAVQTWVRGRLKVVRDVTNELPA